MVFGVQEAAPKNDRQQHAEAENAEESPGNDAFSLDVPPRTPAYTQKNFVAHLPS